VVTALEGDEVVVDFNHPLAGRTVTFEVAVITVEAVEE
jgi:FKBP-type peptidyl-prolyl cis-trans isomerase SlpA